MNPVVSLSTFGMIPPHQAMEQMAKLGLTGIEYPMEQHRGPRFSPELWPDVPHYNLAGLSLEGTAADLKRHGLTCVGVSGHCELAQGRAVDLLSARMRMAKKLWAQYVSTGIGEGWQEPEKHRGAVLANLRALARCAEELDIVLALRPDRWFTSSLREGLETLRTIGSPNLKLALEFPGMAETTGSDGLADELRRALAEIAVIYLTECPTCSARRLDLFALLRTEGYGGPVCISFGNAIRPVPTPDFKPLRIGPWPLDPSHLDAATSHMRHAMQQGGWSCG